MARKVYPAARTNFEAMYLMMSDAWFEQTGNLINCDQQIGSLFNWDAKHLEKRDEARRSTNESGK